MSVNIDDGFLRDWHPVIDKQVGDYLFINNKDAYLFFNADLISILPVTQNVIYSGRVKPGGNSFDILNLEIAKNNYEFSFYVGGTTKENAYYNVNSLLNEFVKCEIHTGIDDCIYNGVLQKYSCAETGVHHYLLLKVEILASKYLPLEKVTFTGSTVIENMGTAESGIKFTFSPGKAISLLTLYKIRIKNIKGTGPVIVDGIEGAVTENGINKFSDTNIISFPKIKPGVNEITCSDSTFPVTVEYYPSFII